MQRSDKGDIPPWGMQRTQLQVHVWNCGPDWDSRATWGFLCLPDTPRPPSLEGATHPSPGGQVRPSLHVSEWSAGQLCSPLSFSGCRSTSVCEPTPSHSSSARRGYPHTHCETLSKGRSGSSGWLLGGLPFPFWPEPHITSGFLPDTPCSVSPKLALISCHLGIHTQIT